MESHQDGRTDGRRHPVETGGADEDMVIRLKVRVRGQLLIVKGMENARRRKCVLKKIEQVCVCGLCEGDVDTSKDFFYIQRICWKEVRTGRNVLLFQSKCVNTHLSLDDNPSRLSDTISLTQTHTHKPAFLTESTA